MIVAPPAGMKFNSAAQWLNYRTSEELKRGEVLTIEDLQLEADALETWQRMRFCLRQGLPLQATPPTARLHEKSF